jgi:DNA-binding NtrC family response regulator
MKDESTTTILLVGGDAALLEGVVQTLAARGYATAVSSSLQEAAERSVGNPPLVAVIDRDFAAEAPGMVLGIPLVRGGALVVFHQRVEQLAMLVPALQRALLADLALPLERNRLLALVQHVEERARATGRRSRDTTPTSQELSR